MSPSLPSDPVEPPLRCEASAFPEAVSSPSPSDLAIALEVGLRPRKLSCKPHPHPLHSLHHGPSIQKHSKKVQFHPTAVPHDTWSIINRAVRKTSQGAAPGEFEGHYQVTLNALEEDLRAGAPEACAALLLRAAKIENRFLKAVVLLHAADSFKEAQIEQMKLGVGLQAIATAGESWDDYASGGGIQGEPDPREVLVGLQERWTTYYRKTRNSFTLLHFLDVFTLRYWDLRGLAETIGARMRYASFCLEAIDEWHEVLPRLAEDEWEDDDEKSADEGSASATEIEDDQMTL